VGQMTPGKLTWESNTGQLILSKIIKIVATSYQILRLKCTKFYFCCLIVSNTVLAMEPKTPLWETSGWI